MVSNFIFNANRSIHTFIHGVYMHAYIHTYIHTHNIHEEHAYIHSYIHGHMKNMHTYNIHEEHGYIHALRGNFQVSFNNFVAMKIAGFEAEDKVFAL